MNSGADIFSGRVLKALFTLGSRVLPVRFTTLIYHRVLPEKDPLLDEPNAQEFSWQMEVLARYFKPAAVSDALYELDKGRVAPGTVCVTFDDGYADNVEVALPILQHFGIPATFFITTGTLDGGRMWNDTVIETVRRLPGNQVDLTDIGLGAEDISDDSRREALIPRLLTALKHLPPQERAAAVEAFGSRVSGLPDDLMMSSDQLITLASSGMEIGAHTVNHPILAVLPEEESYSEIAESAATIERITGRLPRYFAYPNGKPGKDYRTSDRNCIERLGFEAAFSTQRGASGPRTDTMQLPRFTPWDSDPKKFALRLALNGITGSQAPFRSP